MEASNSHPFLRPGRLHTYTAYSIGCAIVWAVILGIVAATGSTDKLHTFTVVFLGWAIGWVSATIARAVYPPPNKWRLSGPTSESGD